VADFVAYAVGAERRCRVVCRRSTVEAAAEYARRHLRAGEGLSVNREDVPRPQLRDAEVFHAVGAPMSRDESVKKSLAWTRVCLAGARAAKKEKRR
jgi:hypothetical protein